MALNGVLVLRGGVGDGDNTSVGLFWSYSSVPVAGVLVSVTLLWFVLLIMFPCRVGGGGGVVLLLF